MPGTENTGTAEELNEDSVVRLEDDIKKLKISKAKAKTCFTKQKNSFLQSIGCKSSPDDLIKSQKKLDDLAENVIDILSELIKLMEMKDKSQVDALIDEMTVFEGEYSKIQSLQVSPQPIAIDSFAGSSIKTSSNDLGQDMWKQLSRVNIPVFSGSKSNYDSWKAAFTACIDKAPATAEYKLLQLRQSLAGDALKAIENLGHSPEAYEVAKERLERKFGGERRQIALHLEELSTIRPIRQGNFKDLEKFADVLDLAVLNLKQNGKEDELGGGYLYSELTKKMNEPLLAQYQRWLSDHKKLGTVLTLRDFIIQEAEYQTVAAETIHGMGQSNYKQSDKQFSATRNQRNVKSYFAKETRICKVCREPHGVWACSKFKSLDLNNRWDAAKQHGLCFRCLGEDHAGRDCKRTRTCEIDGCQKNHHRLLHKKQAQVVDKRWRSSSPREGDLVTVHQTHHSRIEGVALRTVPVIVRNGTKEIVINALLDDGSTKSYLNSDIAAALGLEGNFQRVTVDVLNGHTEVLETMPVDLILESVDRKLCKPMSAFTVNKVAGDMKVIDWAREAKKWPHLQNIKFQSIQRETVDMLIGVDYPELHLSVQEIQSQPGQPFARLTPLGWTCIGGDSVTRSTHFARTYFADNKLEDLTQKFWQMEEVHECAVKPMKPEEAVIMKRVENTLTLENGKYKVKIPWKDDGQEKLSNNYHLAKQRLENTENKLKKTPEVMKMYTETIDKYLEKGYITKLDHKTEPEEGCHYIPHFPVVKMERDTTKTRIVFDASAKDKYYGNLSLNETIHQGPKLHSSLFDVLLRFRHKLIALAGDISEMYMQILMDEGDRPFHRFLWRGMDQSQEPDTYQFASLVFGVNSSPFLAQFVTQHHARQMSEKLPIAAETVLKGTYMDDSLDSFETESEAKEAHNQLVQLWSSCGMKARKWISNSTKVLSAIPQEDRAKELELSDELPTTKTLGVFWMAEQDVLTFKDDNSDLDRIVTKRGFLKRLAAVFDPLGFLSPFVVQGKMLLQELWIAGVDWDEPVPTDLSEKLRRWIAQFDLFSSIRVPRNLCDQNAIAKTLHVFSDASEKAFGAVVYMRSVHSSGATTGRLIASKSKVAPLTATSIPRLELMGAMLGLKLVRTIVKALEMDMEKVTFWTDSSNVLWWIRGHSRQFKPFVANRIGEIQTHTAPKQWRYVPTLKNPADVISRGQHVEMLKTNAQWWEGPDFLQKSEFNWPVSKVSMEVKSTDEERKQVRKPPANFSFVTLNYSSMHMPDRLDATRFSDWTRYKRVFAYVYRFIENCHSEVAKRKTGPLTAIELEGAEQSILAYTQKEAFPEEYVNLSKGRPLPQKSKLLPLKPRLDEDGIIRCDGRLQHATYLPPETKFPIILPSKNHVTTLIIKDCHEKNSHAIGTNHTLSLLTRKYWIVSGREEIRHWERRCNTCKRLKVKSANQVMAPLPACRLKEPLRAFARVAVDYAGPFMTVQGRGKCRQKRYLCLFTCLMSRAVHLEMAHSLDTNAFLNAFFRMVNRRGLPEEIYSDNGTNFVGANKELKELVTNLDEETLKESLANRGVKWFFNPPLAPHFGGVHESMIKAAKRAVMAILSNSDVKDEELITAFTGAEALINSRPLTYQSASPHDDVPLTPNHFLFSQAGGQFLPSRADSEQYRTVQRWRRVQELVSHFWKRWIREWLPTLNARKKWFKEEKDIEVDDIVIILDPDTPRGHWPLGKVRKACKGHDGHVRVVEVQAGQRLMKRPIARVCPLELSDSF